MAIKRLEQGLQRCRPSQIRTLTSQVASPAQTASEPHAAAHLSPKHIKTSPISNPFATTATCIAHSFPSLQPRRTIEYPGSHLLLPLRRDILHRAVVYEGDRTRQGTASSKWRDDVHGSGRKIRPQKGSGMARLGDRKSPMLRGGGAAFGPTPRDFSTGLPRKIYDLAWRTALSYRYRRGELIVIDGQAEIQHTGPGSGRWLREVLDWHGWGRAHGRSLFVTKNRRDNLFDILGKGNKMGAEAKAVNVEQVDVKDLLETGRVVIEQAALSKIFSDHRSDLTGR